MEVVIMEFEVVVNKKAELAETPFWDTKSKRLVWTDLMAGKVHLFDPASGKDTAYDTGKMIGCAIPCTSGKVLCVLEDGLYKLDTQTGGLELLLAVEADRPAYRFNDAGCDAMGRVLISSTAKCYGTPEFTTDMKGSFYLVDTDLSIKKIVDQMEHYNGIVFTKDNKTMYVVDSYNKKVVAFDYDVQKGKASNMRTAFCVPDKYFSPDGMAIDEEENVYITFWNGWMTKWNPQKGELLEEISMGCPFITCPGFGGDDRKDLYIATSTWGYKQEDFEKYPDAGGIYRTRVAVPGRIDYYFKD
jgi:sugar lactone lactonase YvrE